VSDGKVDVMSMVITTVEVTILWFIFCFLSFGVLGFYFVLMRKATMKPWQLRIDEKYMPRISILVPTYNESDVIHFKLENLRKVEYPMDLTQIIIVDSNSGDQTVDIVNNFVAQHPEIHVEVIVESERKGKSAALNLALKNCKGDVVIVSDADCFWPSDILRKALPFLADPNVGAISGPKILLNPNQSWVTKTEDAYLDSMNLMKLGESKIGSTLFFEGGFSAYKREVLESFDPYNTGSDDCGTIINLAKKGFRAIFVPEARFYTAFPFLWKEKVSMKIRRANQLVRVLWRYVYLLFRRRIKGPKRVIIQGFFNYVVGPLMFIALIATTILLLFSFPYFALIFLILLIPTVGSYFLEVVQNYVVLVLSIFAAVFGKKFLIWKKTGDRVLLKEDMLRRHGLI
jgi:cellulose synthase/poly-beta-1,6-N-acetylglucosamine synthase-like glycosyltransferase